MEVGRYRGTMKISQPVVILTNKENFKIFVSSLKNQNSNHEEIKCELKAGHSCYYSVEKRLSSRLLSKNLKFKIYKTIVLPVVLCSSETWPLALREEFNLRVFENKIMDENGGGEGLTVRNYKFLVLTSISSDPL
jgi:hypothetical protein